MKNKVKRYCECDHKGPDYWCVCWLDGFETGDAEKMLNNKAYNLSVHKKDIEKERLQNIRLELLKVLDSGKRILNTRWGSLWWIKK
mgnify:CR=1 FL=1